LTAADASNNPECGRQVGDGRNKSPFLLCRGNAAYTATRAGKVSHLWIVARAVGEEFDCFVFGLVLLAFGGCPPCL